MIRFYALIFTIATSVFSFDQWSKFLAVAKLQSEGNSIPVNSWWSWTLVHNHAAAFSMFSFLPDSFRAVFLTLLPLCVLVLFWFLFLKNANHDEIFKPVVFGLVLGGALGNIVDRIRLSYVIDFVDWFYPSSGKCFSPFFFKGMDGNCHWAVFNVADVAISTSICLLFIASFVMKEEPPKKKSKKKS